MFGVSAACRALECRSCRLGRPGCLLGAFRADGVECALRQLQIDGVSLADDDSLAGDASEDDEEELEALEADMGASYGSCREK